ncbi:MAG: hypothetical protein EBQ92_00230 [Proteobacteria bacterium]|nr:hypothetical protein [Pseudomonadota bacterium]
MEAEFTEAEPEPVEHWTEETVGEWEGAFARCSTLEAVNAAVEGLKVEKKAHPAISSTMNKRLGDAYNKAKARVEATE